MRTEDVERILSRIVDILIDEGYDPTNEEIRGLKILLEDIEPLEEVEGEYDEEKRLDDRDRARDMNKEL